MRMYVVYLVGKNCTFGIDILAEDMEKVYNPELDKWYLRFYRDKEMIAEFALAAVAGWVENLQEQGGNNDAAC